MNYKKLMSYDPTVYETTTNSLGQEIQLVEHPTKGDEAPVIAVCHALELADYTDFYDIVDITNGIEYEPLFIDGKLTHGNN